MGLFIIAEIGSVHDGSFGNALKSIELAKDVGADAVKFQTHISEAETLKNAPNPSYFKGESRFDYFKRTGFSKKQWLELKQYCDEQNITFLSSPFSIEAAHLLHEIGMELFKVPSGEITNLPLIEYIASLGKPIIISSGMSNWRELDVVNEIVSDCEEVTYLQCTSEYPCKEQNVGLNILEELSERYNRPVGLSDHTLGLAAGLGAVSLGGSVIEKHITFSKYMYGSDAKNAMEPSDFRQFCVELRSLEKMLNNPVEKDDILKYEDMKLIFQKSIVVTAEIQKGEKLSHLNLSFKKPGDGIPASDYKSVFGATATKYMKPDHKLQREDFEK